MKHVKKDIRPEDLQAKLVGGEQIRIIDVRSPVEFASGHVPGASNVPLETIQHRIPSVGHTEPVVMVCQAGVRSEAACQKVKDNYAHLFNLTGGTTAWIAAGFPIEPAA